ncbi:lauroyl acyltransferase [Microvirga tunisiensis]|uniref:Lauroyl acyltransferase n=1 Tax=Pannonibacter tanglangensis TaxID=2750084 RepID=A0A7X5J916_9HYPH|nr:lauroyl acyltransferase [Pannonibacter sp. XCT-53]NBN77850.1 lauroyl acyltransferase [Pannonibacter sp. XCT-53]
MSTAPSRPLAAVLRRLEWAALAVVFRLFRLVPVDLASATMGWLWRRLAPLNSRHRRALRHLAAAMPELPEAERRRIIADMWTNLGRVTAETFHIDRLLRDRSRYEIVVDEMTRDIIANRRACLFVSLHTGNWELCVAPAVWEGMEITGVYQALKNEHSDALLRGLRQDLYKGGLLSKGHQAARRLISTLRQGGVVAIMGDLRERRGVHVPFFGRPATATPVPVALARSCDVPIVIGRTVRLDGVRFRVEGRAFRPQRTEDRDSDIQAGCEVIHAQFEAWIREYPAQWMWIHRKWDH